MNERAVRFLAASAFMCSAKPYSLMPSAGSASGFFSRMESGITCEINSSTDSTPMTFSISARSAGFVTPMWRSMNLSNMVSYCFNILVFVNVSGQYLKLLPPMNSRSIEVGGISSEAMGMKLSRNFSRRLASPYSGSVSGTSRRMGSTFERSTDIS